MSQDSVQDILFSCSEAKHLSAEHFVSENGLSHIFSGEMRVADAERVYLFKAGDSFVFSRNRLAKVVKWPAGDGTPFKSVTIFFRQDFLRQY